MDQARDYAGRIVGLTGGKSLYWRVKALGKGLAHLRTGETRYRVPSLLERFNVRYGRVIGWVSCGQSITC